jgi:hypothetical protein
MEAVRMHYDEGGMRLAILVKEGRRFVYTVPLEVGRPIHVRRDVRVDEMGDPIGPRVLTALEPGSARKLRATLRALGSKYGFASRAARLAVRDAA